MGNWGCLAWVRLQQLHEQRYPFLAVCAAFCVSRQWCGCQCVELLMWAQMLMYVIAYGGCKNSTWGDKFFATLWSWTCISIVSGFSFWHPQLGHLSYISLLPSLFILTLSAGPSELRFSPSLPLHSDTLSWASWVTVLSFPPSAPLSSLKGTFLPVWCEFKWLCVLQIVAIIGVCSALS